MFDPDAVRTEHKEECQDENAVFCYRHHLPLRCECLCELELVTLEEDLFRGDRAVYQCKNCRKEWVRP